MRSSVTTTAAVLGIIALAACDDSASNHPTAPAALRTTQLASSGAFVAEVGNDTTAQNETPIAVNPANPQNLIVGATDWNYNDGCAVNPTCGRGSTCSATLPNG